MQILTKHKSIKKGDYTYNLMGVNKPTHIHINNHKTNDKSIIVPISTVKELITE